MEFLCLELITREIPSRDTEDWLDGCTPDGLIEILWNVGFLPAEGVRSNGRRRAGSEAFLGVHQVPHLNIAAARNFQVHPMFWAHLGSGNGAR